jgi:hypothetical protein
MGEIEREIFERLLGLQIGYSDQLQNAFRLPYLDYSAFDGFVATCMHFSFMRFTPPQKETKKEGQKVCASAEEKEFSLSRRRKICLLDLGI